MLYRDGYNGFEETETTVIHFSISKGASTMSWLLIFLSSYVPIVMLFFLVLMNWLHDEIQSNAAHAGLRGR